jgi:hypothetical protein
MKARIAILFASLGVACCCRAQWAVFDAVNLQQSVTNYAAMVQQIAKQGEQIANQVRQIQQMEDQLKRMGDMAHVKAVVGFPELKLDLGLPTRIRTWAEGIGKIDGYGIFGDTRSGVFREIPAEFPDFNGGSVARDPTLYRSAQDITSSVDNFKEVQTDVYARREELKRAIAQTSEALAAAETEAEEKKLEAVLNAQYSQLAGLDSEIGLSAAEIQVKAAESAAMNAAASEADAETRSKLAQQEATKVTKTFKPVYDCFLRYVTEKPLKP